MLRLRIQNCVYLYLHQKSKNYWISVKHKSVWGNLKAIWFVVPCFELNLGFGQPYTVGINSQGYGKSFLYLLLKMKFLARFFDDVTLSCNYWSLRQKIPNYLLYSTKKNLALSLNCRLYAVLLHWLTIIGFQSIKQRML